MRPLTFMRIPRGLLRALTVVAFTLCAQRALALGVLETPAADRIATGIDLVSGWHCTASRIEIRVDDGPLQVAGSGTARDDTATVCGRTDTGFALLLNFNLLDAGEHTLAAYADGALFTTTTFTTTRHDVPYVTGLSGTFPLLNFPNVGTTTVVQWQEEKQNFSIVGTTAGPQIAGTYYGVFKHSLDCGDLRLVDPGTFTVTLADSALTVAASYRGHVCRLSADTVVTDGAVRSVPGPDNVSTCPEFGTFQVVVDGLRISAYNPQAGCGGYRLVGAK